MKKRIYSRKEKIILTIYISVIILVSLVLTFFLSCSKDNVFDTAITVPLMLTTIGVSIAMFSFVTNLIQNIEKNIERKKITVDRKRKLYSLIDIMFVELSDDLKILFISLIVILFVNIINDFRFDFTFNLKSFEISKRSILLFLKISFTIASLFSIKDIITCIIKISRLGRIISKIRQKTFNIK